MVSYSSDDVSSYKFSPSENESLFSDSDLIPLDLNPFQQKKSQIAKIAFTSLDEHYLKISHKIAQLPNEEILSSQNSSKKSKIVSKIKREFESAMSTRFSSLIKELKDKKYDNEIDKVKANAEMELAEFFVKKSIFDWRNSEDLPEEKANSNGIEKFSIAHTIFQIAEKNALMAITAKQVAAQAENMLKGARALQLSDDSLTQASHAAFISSNTASACRDIIYCTNNYISAIDKNYEAGSSGSETVSLLSDYAAELLKVTELVEDMARDLSRVIAKIEDSPKEIRSPIDIAGDITESLAFDILLMAREVNGKIAEMVLDKEQCKLILLKSAFANLFNAASSACREAKKIADLASHHFQNYTPESSVDAAPNEEFAFSQYEVFNPNLENCRESPSTGDKGTKRYDKKEAKVSLVSKIASDMPLDDTTKKLGNKKAKEKLAPKNKRALCCTIL